MLINTFCAYKYLLQAKRSQLCMLTTEEFDQVNKFLSCMSHSYIQKITSVKLLVSIEFGSQVIISQPFWIRGSLRDLIHRVVRRTGLSLSVILI